MTTRYKIRWTKNVDGKDVFDEGCDVWQNINDAFMNLMMYLRWSPKADGYIEKVAQ